ncbi:MAG: hypothetical protein ACK56I_30450, partial [bacterium]
LLYRLPEKSYSAKWASLLYQVSNNLYEKFYNPGLAVFLPLIEVKRFFLLQMALNDNGINLN